MLCIFYHDLKKCWKLDRKTQKCFQKPLQGAAFLECELKSYTPGGKYLVINWSTVPVTKRFLGRWNFGAKSRKSQEKRTELVALLVPSKGAPEEQRGGKVANGGEQGEVVGGRAACMWESKPGQDCLHLQGEKRIFFFFFQLRLTSGLP